MNAHTTWDIVSGLAERRDHSDSAEKLRTVNIIAPIVEHSKTVRSPTKSQQIYDFNCNTADQLLDQGLGPHHQL